jgi:putative nucleotidyltransferase with HDIG domain
MNQRVSFLEALLEARYPGCIPPDLCAAFDQAVEFAACEGRSIRESVAEFFDEEDWGPAQAKLAEIVRPAAVPSPKALPVLPKAASKLLRTKEEEVTVNELEQIAAADPVLSARLVSAANSVRYGSRFQIVRLRDAAMRLGVPEARRTLIQASIGGVFASADLRELWDHSQLVASAAFELAIAVEVDPESAWLAGLLHDIGRLGFITMPAPTRTAERRWLDARFPLVYAETLVYGLDHGELGGRLLSAWEIPQSVVAAVSMHHRPEATESRLAAALYLAEDAPVRVGVSCAEDLWTELRRRTACDRLGIRLERLAEMDAGGERRLVATA